MDDHSFHQQLHTLKERVSDLSFNRSPILAPHDPFESQLQALKAQMVLMQARLARYERSMPQMTFASETEGPVADSRTCMETPSGLLLPSGPVLWRLFDGLRTDVQSLDGRVASLESTISDLEDKIDGMDPNRFTPPESPSEIEATSPPNFTCPSSDIDIPHISMPELSSDVAFQPPANPNQPYKATGWTNEDQCNMLHLNSDESGQRYLHPLQNSTLPPLLASENYTSDEMSAAPVARGLQYQDMGIVNQNDKGSGISPVHLDDTKLVNPKPKPGESKVRRFQTYEEAVQSGKRMILTRYPDPFSPPTVAKTSKLIPKPRASKSAATQLPIPVGGVTFRDREIARLDEQLRIAHERLRISEGVVSEKQSMIAQLQSKQDNLEGIIRHQENKEWELEESNAQYQSNLGAKEAEMRDLRVQINERDTALQACRENESRFNESYEQLWARLREYKRTMREERRREDSAFERIDQEHQSKMKALENFCEQKDAVIHKQEQIILRGRELLEQKDDEIENLQREIRIREDEKEHTIRTAKRMARLLEERDAELLYLKEASQTQVSKQNNLEDYHEDIRFRKLNGTEDEGSESVSSIQAMVGGSSEHQNNGLGDEAPRLARASNSLSHDARNTYLWDNAIPENDQAHFDNPGSTRSSRDRKRRGRASGRHRHQPPQDPSREDLKAVASREVSLGRARMKQTTLDQLDDATLRPPLPAPQATPRTARRMVSEADLRAKSPTDNMSPRKGLSKYHSMQNLRGRLQAYVETEEESGGEVGGFGGEV